MSEPGSRRAEDRKKLNGSKPIIATGAIAVVVTALLTSWVQGNLVPRSAADRQSATQSRLGNLETKISGFEGRFDLLEGNLAKLVVRTEDRYTGTDAKRDQDRLQEWHLRIEDKLDNLQVRLGILEDRFENLVIPPPEVRQELLNHEERIRLLERGGG